MRGVSMLSKAPGGRLGILGMYNEGRPTWGSVVHAWLHTDKHIETLNFYVNFRVLGGFCGSIGVKQGGAPGGDRDLKTTDWVSRSPCFSD